MTNKKSLNRDAILASDDMKPERVPVPEWSGDVYVRVMTADERDAWELEMWDEKGQRKSDHVRASLVTRTVVNEKGERVFGDADVEALGAKSAAAVDRVFKAAQRLNGLARQDIEDLVKN